MTIRLWPLAGLLSLLTPSPALPCSLCSNVRQTTTFRQEITHLNAKMILHGTFSNGKLVPGKVGAGTTDFTVLDVLRCEATVPAALRAQKGAVLSLNVYVPTEDPQKPPRYLLFCNVVDGKLDIYRYVETSSTQGAEYAREIMALDARDTRKALLFYFRYLDHPDREVANDAFMEFAKASDRDIGEVASQFSPLKLRKLLRDPLTPDHCLGLYAFLLGRCGNKDDLAWFQSTLSNPGSRFNGAYDGVLGGFIQMKPAEGWVLAETILREGKHSLIVRLSVVRMLRFYQAWKPAEARPIVLRAMAALLANGELVDLAAEDLRKWQVWDLTEQVLGLYGRKGLDASIQKRAILRYALNCPRPEAKAFLEARRKAESDLVREVEEGLRRVEN